MMMDQCFSHQNFTFTSKFGIHSQNVRLSQNPKNQNINSTIFNYTKVSFFNKNTQTTTKRKRIREIVCNIWCIFRNKSYELLIKMYRIAIFCHSCKMWNSILLLTKWFCVSFGSESSSKILIRVSNYKQMSCETLLLPKFHFNALNIFIVVTFTTQT